MNIITPYAKILPVPGNDSFTKEHGIVLLKHIEWCARISHRSEEAVTEDSFYRFLRSVVLNHGDWSVVEHASVSVDAVVDRGIQQEWTRHRLASYTIESTRFVNYEKKMPPGFIRPNFGNNIIAEHEWETTMVNCEISYQTLIHAGVAPQLARSVFPLSLASKIVTTANLRNWRHLFLMRTTREAHPQIREVFIPLLEEFQEKIPILYEDIEPLEKQADNLRKGR